MMAFRQSPLSKDVFERAAFRLALAVAVGLTCSTPPVSAQQQILAPELQGAARIVRDVDGIAHISAANEHDLFFIQGWVEASDRLFQMDVLRHLASGSLAELVGSGALSRDVELRAFGLRDTAEASLPLLLPEVQAAFAAYSDGVNAYVAANPLPTEYQLLGLNSVEPWTPVDTMAIAKLQAFGTAFDTIDLRLTEAFIQYIQAGSALGFDGAALFSEDLFRAQPFDPAATIPDSEQVSASERAFLQAVEGVKLDELEVDPEVAQLARQYLERTAGIAELTPDLVGSGSNMWVIAGEHTESGRPLLANDPHPTQLSIPTTFYPVHLQAPGIDVIGNSFPGAPFVIQGHNRFIAWGLTSNPLDLTDWFQEQLCPAGPLFGVLHLGECKPVTPRPELFQYNQGGELTTATPGSIVDGVFIPPVVPIVPHRGNGPIVSLGATTALSVQFTGFSPTREPNGFYLWNKARDLDDFVDGLQFIDAGANSWVCADVGGNIGYFTDSEVPLRADLQDERIDGNVPPFFIRSGLGMHDWLPAADPQSPDAVPYEILPFEEMPQTVNPPAGIIINSNNDQVGLVQDNNPLNQLRPGGGIYYLNPSYPSIRAGRVTELIQGMVEAHEKFVLADMEAIQADVVLLDAKVFVPYILDAFENAGGSSNELLTALAEDPGVLEAIGRLDAWDFSAPTGIPEGYDASDETGELAEPSQDEIEASIAATIYAAWRSRMLVNSIDSVLPADFQRPHQEEAVTALRHLLENFDTDQGIGASGLNFFEVAGVSDAATRRDIVLLKSLADALQLLASPAFAAAFGESTDQDDYRWGLLHRVTLYHPLDADFNVPPAGGQFEHPLGPALPGIPSDGGFEVVDASSHDVRAAIANEFTFDRPDVPSTVPAFRFVAELSRSRPKARYSLPGGISGELFRTFPAELNPIYINLLPRYLTNDNIPLRTRPGGFGRGGSQQVFVPG